jgi:hypothetical protein
VSETDPTMGAVGAPEIKDRVAPPGVRLPGPDSLVAEAQSRCVAGAG